MRSGVPCASTGRHCSTGWTSNCAPNSSGSLRACAFVVLLSLLCIPLPTVVAAPPQPDTAQGLGSAPLLEKAWAQPTIREEPTRIFDSSSKKN